MKDTHGLKDMTYKEVVIIGNGPSGIILSYMLSGHWPYWDPEKIKFHPDELLRARLSYADHTKSLVEQELMTLADGLEGRCTNPVSLLLDSLQNPCADLGMDLPSMLKYEYKPENQIDHIVLGKGPPGGSWHKMDPNLRTLSLAAWMSLPSLDYGLWESHDESTTDKNTIQVGLTQQTQNSNNKKPKSSRNACTKCQTLREDNASNFKQIDRSGNIMLHNNNNYDEVSPSACNCSKVSLKFNLTDDKRLTVNEVNSRASRNSNISHQVTRESQSRALVSKVAKYYESYVTNMKLQKYFVNDVVVTSIIPMHWKDPKCKGARWIVVGKKLSSGKTFSYCCKNVVLANGVSDLPNRLGLKAEKMEISWIKHELPQLEKSLEELTARERASLKPVIIVGAGLSAADCVTICRSLKIPVIHVYRNRTAGLDKMLPEKVYPEYHSVHKMMKDKSGAYDYYTPLPEHTIIDVSTQGDHLVTLQHLKTGETRQIEVSFCTILIGSRPDLRLLSNISMKNSCETIRDECPLSENGKVAARQINWLKNLSEKCRHLNLCKWGRQKEYKSVCGQNTVRRWTNCKSIQFENESTVKHMNLLNEKTNNEDSRGPDSLPNRMINNNLLLNNNQISNVDDCPKNVTKYLSCKLRSMENQISESELVSITLGEDSTKPIDCKTNPIAVDKYTNEVLRVNSHGLYAMGPLVGDNFIRFIPGGALAITSALHKRNIGPIVGDNVLRFIPGGCLPVTNAITTGKYQEND